MPGLILQLGWLSRRHFRSGVALICQNQIFPQRGWGKFSAVLMWLNSRFDFLSTFLWELARIQGVNPNAKPEPAATHPNIQEILRERREMLNRVRADLDKVGKLQQDFWVEEQKRQSEQKENK